MVHRLLDYWGASWYRAISFAKLRWGVFRHDFDRSKTASGGGRSYCTPDGGGYNESEPGPSRYLETGSHHQTPLYEKGNSMASRNSNGNGRTDRAETGIKAVLYLRMSSAKQDESIDQQRDQLVSYAKQHGYEIVREYADQAISGDDTARRTEFLRMREDAGRGEFSVVLCWDQDRFGRFDPIEGGYWILPFRDNGVRLETITQGRIDWTDFAGRLLYVVQQEAKHAYLRDLSRNVLRGQAAAARNGNRRGIGGGGPTLDGYRRLPDGSVEVDQDRAEIVQRIFTEYLTPSGSLRSVTTGLNLAGVKTLTGGKWTVGRIRKTLTNRKYCGCFVRFRWSGGSYFGLDDGGEIVSRTKTQGKTERDQPLITVPDNHPAIIDAAVFDQAQNKLAANRTETTRRDSRVFPFQGLLRCSDCGGVMGGRGSRYICSTYHREGRGGCQPNQISEKKLEAAVVNLLRREYCGPDRIRDLRQALERELADETKSKPVDQSRLAKRIETLDQQISRGAERLLSVPESLVETITGKLTALQEQRDRLQSELDAGGCTETAAEPLDRETVDQAIEALERLSERLTDAKPEDLRELIRGLIVRIELHFDHPATAPGKRAKHTFTEGVIVSHMFPVSGIDRRTVYQM